MDSILFISIILLYFLFLLFISWKTSRNANSESFFIGNRNSNWMLVAFGMIGTSLSGVTFISVPGTVGNFDGEAHRAFGYLQVVFGYWLGYLVVALVLLPLYYKLNLTSIYKYLQVRFGNIAYKTGALFFIISRTIGATARLYLVINVLQLFIFDNLGIPFIATSVIILLMILLYTYEGGVKTIVYTDTLQTSFMLIGLIVCIVYILTNLNLSLPSVFSNLENTGFTHIFNGDYKSKGYFLKQIVGGMFIAIAMTGLDQEMMQKNISVKNVKDAKKNMLSFSIILVIVNFLFLLLGGILYLFMMQNGGSYDGNTFIANGTNIIGDSIFPTVALNYLPNIVSIIFIIALISALFPSADGALTALTSSFCIDMLGFKTALKVENINSTNKVENEEKKFEKIKRKRRIIVHICFTIIFLICILIFKWINNKSIISIILDLASYTYGPLLGLFAFGIFTKRRLKNNLSITFICILAPIICYFLSLYSSSIFNGYQIGIELLLINGLLTFIGLFFISENSQLYSQNNLDSTYL